MAILVTGGAGFIGSNFINDWFLDSDEEIINLDKLSYAGNLKSLDNVLHRKEFKNIKGDICHKDLVSDILHHYNPRAIIHFAAETHVDRSIDDPTAFMQTNIIGTFNLLNTTYEWFKERNTPNKNQFRFLHVSTDEVYGSLDINDKSFTETSPFQPNNPYAASKAASDHIVRSYYHTYGLPVITTHCSNNYGPYQFPEKLIPLMIQKAIQGKDLPIYGDGQHIRDWLYVTDHCSAIRLVLEKGILGETYNIGGNCEKTNLEVVHMLCDILDKFLPNPTHTSYRNQISFVPDRMGHDRRYAIDSQKIKNELGWTPQHSFADGIQKTVEWLLNRGK